MPPSSERLQDTGSRGKLRVLVALAVALPLAFLAWRAAFAFVFAPLAPGVVLGFFPGYPDAVEMEIARGMIGPNQKLISPDAAARERLRASLQRQPMSSLALRLLAMSEDVDGAKPEAVRYLEVADAIGRRDVATEVFLGKDAIARRDVVKGMRYFDAALATNSNAQQLLFPVMAQVLALPELRTAMGEYVEREWAGSFLKFAVSQARPDFVEELALRKPAAQKDEEYAEFRSTLIARYAAAGELDRATAYARRVARDGKALDAFGLNALTTDQTLAPVAWRLADDGNVVADMDTDGVFAAISPGSRGIVMYREIALRPGGYTLSTRYSTVGLPGEFTADWQVACLRGSGQGKLGALALPFSAEPKVRAVRIAVPVGCRAAAFILTANNFDDQSDAELTIHSLGLEPAS